VVNDNVCAVLWYITKPPGKSQPNLILINVLATCKFIVEVSYSLLYYRMKWLLTQLSRASHLCSRCFFEVKVAYGSNLINRLSKYNKCHVSWMLFIFLYQHFFVLNVEYPYYLKPTYELFERLLKLRKCPRAIVGKELESFRSQVLHFSSLSRKTFTSIISVWLQQNIYLYCKHICLKTVQNADLLLFGWPYYRSCLWHDVLSVCLSSVCDVLYCGETVRHSEKVSEGVNRKPGSKSSFFGSPPYFYFRFHRYGHRGWGFSRWPFPLATTPYYYYTTPV